MYICTYHTYVVHTYVVPNPNSSRASQHILLPPSSDLHALRAVSVLAISYVHTYAVMMSNLSQLSSRITILTVAYYSE